METGRLTGADYYPSDVDSDDNGWGSDEEIVPSDVESDEDSDVESDDEEVLVPSPPEGVDMFGLDPEGGYDPYYDPSIWWENGWRLPGSNSRGKRTVEYCRYWDSRDYDAFGWNMDGNYNPHYDSRRWNSHGRDRSGAYSPYFDDSYTPYDRDGLGPYGREDPLLDEKFYDPDGWSIPPVWDLLNEDKHYNPYWDRRRFDKDGFMHKHPHYYNPYHDENVSDLQRSRDADDSDDESDGWDGYYGDGYDEGRRRRSCDRRAQE